MQQKVRIFNSLKNEFSGRFRKLFSYDSYNFKMDQYLDHHMYQNARLHRCLGLRVASQCQISSVLLSSYVPKCHITSVFGSSCYPQR